jgi:hypothetical protein
MGPSTQPTALNSNVADAHRCLVLQARNGRPTPCPGRYPLLTSRDITAPHVTRRGTCPRGLKFCGGGVGTGLEARDGRAG